MVRKGGLPPRKGVAKSFSEKQATKRLLHRERTEKAGP
jgi:hypothetical protein